MDMDPDSSGKSIVCFTSSHPVASPASEILRDHKEGPLQKEDHAKLWHHTSLREVELFHGSYRKYQFARHFHRVPAIGVVDRGAMRTFCRGEEHLLGPGTVLLLNSGEIHAPAPAGESGWSFRMFYLAPSFFAALSPGNRPDVAVFKQAFVPDRELANKLFHLHVALESKGQRLEFESSFASIFHDLANRYVDTRPTDPDVKADNTAVDSALQYLEANCHRNLSLDELSQHSPYGVSHFTRVFQKTVGLTPHAYLLQLRVERAKSLVQSGVPITDASDALGFVDQSHLTRHFKRILGVTPGQYARSAQA